ncbi:hypothetical protein [Coleofasciculus sp. H7-2]|uniref:hypothetical protein n=1 Tax=Coleofasciculus sp. H7-2 TaxID=3351545 RepID=UPI00366A7756
MNGASDAAQTLPDRRRTPQKRAIAADWQILAPAFTSLGRDWQHQQASGAGENPKAPFLVVYQRGEHGEAP